VETFASSLIIILLVMKVRERKKDFLNGASAVVVVAAAAAPDDDDDDDTGLSEWQLAGAVVLTLFSSSRAAPGWARLLLRWATHCGCRQVNHLCM